MSTDNENPKNYVSLVITTESGCDPAKGEYTLSLVQIVGFLDLSSPGGADDISLIRDAIENEIDFAKLPEEGLTAVRLRETGEREDVFWNKYYVVEAVTPHG